MMYKFDSSKVMESSEALSKKCVELGELEVRVKIVAERLEHAGADKTACIRLRAVLALIGEQRTRLMKLSNVLQSASQIYIDGDMRATQICTGEQKGSEQFIETMIGTGSTGADVSVPINIDVK